MPLGAAVAYLDVDVVATVAGWVAPGSPGYVLVAVQVPQVEVGTVLMVVEWNSPEPHPPAWVGHPGD